MWHSNTAAALVSFSSISFEECLKKGKKKKKTDLKVVCWILSKLASSAWPTCRIQWDSPDDTVTHRFKGVIH